MNGTEVGAGDVVTFAFIPGGVTLGPKAPQNRTVFKSWTPAQVACSNRASRIAIIEVRFDDGKSWAAPIDFERVFRCRQEGFCDSLNQSVPGNPRLTSRSVAFFNRRGMCRLVMALLLVQPRGRFNLPHFPHSDLTT